MLIAGAKGHAIEILDILEYNMYAERIGFFDDISIELPNKIADKYMILKKETDVKAWFADVSTSFIIGIGKGKRKILADKLISLGGCLVTIISDSAIIGKNNVNIGCGVNLMHHVMVSSNVSIGKGALINARSIIHHNCQVGSYCEVGPGSILTGGVTIENNVILGTGVKILPNVKVGNNAIIGAGALVTKNVKAGSKLKGIPAKEY